MGKKRMSTFTIVLLVLFASVITMVIALNFVSGEKKIKHAVDKRYSIDDPQVLRSMGALLGPVIVPGNRVQTPVNGDQIFPAMLAEVRVAKKSITLETYIYWYGTIGKEFSEALSERARRGKLLEAGAEISEYQPTMFHCKVMVIDDLWSSVG